MNRTKIIFSIATLITVILLIFYYVSAFEKTRSIHHGEIDLSQTDFNEKGVIALDGEWEFYWNQFLNPSDFIGAQHEFHYLNVPGNWMLDQDGNTYAQKGYATYRVTIRIFLIRSTSG